MPNKDAAKKALRQAVKLTARNLQVKKRIEYLERKIQQAFKSSKTEEVKKLYRDLQQILDKAAKKNIFHPNKSSRLKSRLMKKINNLR